MSVPLAIPDPCPRSEPGTERMGTAPDASLTPEWRGGVSTPVWGADPRPAQGSLLAGAVPGLQQFQEHREQRGRAGSAGAADPGLPDSPPTAQKQLKVAHRGRSEE